MPQPLGYSFAPTGENAEQGKQGGKPPQTSQSALQTINYRLPKVQGSAAISPLISQDQAGSPFSSAVIQSVLRTVLGPGGLDAFRDSGGESSDDSFLRGLSGMGASQEPSNTPNFSRPRTWAEDAAQEWNVPLETAEDPRFNPDRFLNPYSGAGDGYGEYDNGGVPNWTGPIFAPYTPSGGGKAPAAPAFHVEDQNAVPSRKDQYGDLV